MLDNSCCLKKTSKKQLEKNGKVDVHSKCDSPNIFLGLSPKSLKSIKNYFCASKLSGCKGDFQIISHPLTVCYPVIIQSSEEPVQTGPSPSLVSVNTTFRTLFLRLQT